MPNKIIMAESLKQVEEKANVTKKILGILPYKYEDFNKTKINVKKMSEIIKSISKDLLRSEEKNQINTF